jgi:hypothetical protein
VMRRRRIITISLKAIRAERGEFWGYLYSNMHRPNILARDWPDRGS